MARDRDGIARLRQTKRNGRAKASYAAGDKCERALRGHLPCALHGNADGFAGLGNRQFDDFYLNRHDTRILCH